MKTGTIRLLLGSIAALGLIADPLPAQDIFPPPATPTVVSAVQYEPAHPRPQPPREVKQANFQEPTADVPGVPQVDFAPAPRDDVYRFWGRAEYLNWWISRAPVAVPLVTAARPPSIGALGEPGTTVLFGQGSGQDTGFGNLTGARMTIGGWLERTYAFGWEFTGFGLERGNSLFSATSAGGAAPGVSIPFNATVPFNNNPGGETSFNSGGAPSNVTVDLTSQLWGLELNELAYIWSDDQCYFTGVLGLRYLSLDETLTLTHTTFDVARNGNLAVADVFKTYNQYFAAQIGARTGGTFGRFTLDTSAMLMVGPMRQVVSVAGGTTVTGGAFGFADGTSSGGIFAQSSNIGSQSRTATTFGTELQFKVGYAITRWFQPFFAYNALYLNHVARPGNQIVRNVNPTQNAFFVPPGTLAGNAAPVTTFQNSDFWAHGFQVGFELRY